MILDSQALFSDAQAITVTAASTNYFDKGVAKIFFGKGRRVQLFIQVTEAFAAAGAATLRIDLEQDDNAAFGSPTLLYTAAPGGVLTIGKATLVAGYYVAFPLQGLADTERYIRLNFTVATGPMTAGKLTAGLVLGNNYQSRDWL